MYSFFYFVILGFFFCMQFSLCLVRETQVVQIGSKVVFTCESDREPIWQFQQDGSFTEVETLDNFVRSKSGQEYSLAFTIGQHLSYYETKWRCKDKSSYGVMNEWNLKLYEKPKSPTCSPPVLTDENSYFRTTCTTEKVYPKAECSWSLTSLSDNKIVKTNNRADYKSVKLADEYFKTECTIKQSISELFEGSYRFTVTMTPDISPACTDCSIDVNSQVITLGKTILQLENCPDDYIKQGDIYTCDCVISQPGIPPVNKVTWTGPGIADVSGNPAVLSFIAIYNLLYKCRTNNPAKHFDPEIEYRPKVAFGPESVSVIITLKDETAPSSIDFCNNDTFLTITCLTHESDVNPGHPNMRLLVNNMIIVNYKVSSYGVLGYYITHNYRLQGPGGLTTFNCQSQNLKFSYLFMETSKNITIRKPPAAPLFEVSGETINHFYTTDREGTHEVKCFVRDGYPKLSKLILSCADQKQEVQNSNTVSMDIKLNKDSNGLTCRCFGEHVTGCYTQNSATFTVNFQYQAKVLSFKAKKANGVDMNSNNEELTVDEGDSVEFSCQSDGNPTPQVVISKDKSQTDRVYGNKWTRSMDCGDTDTYYCVAENGIGDSDSRKIQVFVRCFLRIKESDSTPRSLVIKNGTRYYTVLLDVIGYPLSATEKFAVNINSEPLNALKYRLYYRQISKTEGLVYLTFVEMTMTDSGDYLLYSDSEGQMKFVYQLTISVEGDKEMSKDYGDCGSSCTAAILIVSHFVAALVSALIVGFIFFCCCRKRG